MNGQRIQDLEREWRTAERRGDDPAADAAFAALFRELPLEAPSPGFGAATLARVRTEVWAESEAVAPAAARGERHPVAAARWAVAVLALLSAGTLGLSVFVVSVVPRLALGGAVALFNRVLVATWEWIATGITLWVRAAEWSALLARVVAVPEVSWSLLAAVAASFAAFSLLRRILAHEKEPSYAEHL